MKFFQKLKKLIKSTRVSSMAIEAELYKINSKN